MDQIHILQERITHLEKHISEQDAEMYKWMRCLESLQGLIKKLELRLAALEEGNGDMPANEKPPHY
ncbi:MAG: SlyX family protein [Verrucomicrobiota bacterium]